MLDIHLVSNNHERRYSIALSGEDGWEVRVEEDRAVRVRELYSDWHRVERRRTRLELEVSTLLDHGWRLLPA